MPKGDINMYKYLCTMFFISVSAQASVFENRQIDSFDSMVVFGLGIVGAVLGAIYRSESESQSVKIWLADIVFGVISSMLCFVILTETYKDAPLSVYLLTCLSAGFFGRKSFYNLMKRGKKDDEDSN